MSAAHSSSEGHSVDSEMIALYRLLPTVLKKITSAQYILAVSRDRYEQMNVCMYVCVLSL